MKPACNEERSTVIACTTPDFQTFTDAPLNLTGKELNAVGIWKESYTTRIGTAGANV